MSRLTSLPSCGLTLLRAPEETFDYVLRVTTDDKHYARIHCHKAVLKAHSPRLCQMMMDANYFELEIKLSPGFMGAFIELIQYMYLRDITMISQKQKILKLCAMFDMPLDIFLIRTDAIQPINTYRSVAFTIVSSPVDPQAVSSCITVLDFLTHIEFENADMLAEKDLLPQTIPIAIQSVTEKHDVEIQTEEPDSANTVHKRKSSAKPKQSNRKRKTKLG